MTGERKFKQGGGHGRRSRTVLIGGLLAATLAVAAVSLQSPGDPSAADPTLKPTPTQGAVSAPSPTQPMAYDAVFTGDATGGSDVSAALGEFLSANSGRHVALAEGGIYRITQVTFTASDLTVDFRGARLEAIQIGVPGILRIVSSSDVTLNDPSIVGTGYEWVGGEANPNQFEHGILINGGSNITINAPIIRDTRGDGIYIGYDVGVNETPTGIVINEPDIERSARNGIAPVAGEVSIYGGRISQSGLHGIDFEPNDDQGARSIVGVVDGVDIRRFQDLDVAGLTGFAIAAAGENLSTRTSIRVERVTGDELRMLIPDTASVTVRGNLSDIDAIVDFQGSDTVVFTDNVRLRRR